MSKIRDLLAEKEAFEERIAICMYDGGLTYMEAITVADRQLQETLRAHDLATREDRLKARWERMGDRPVIPTYEKPDLR